jgi:ribose/xylose/arabinose/galactoside ABC-type transport system permease subunit
VIYTGMGWIIMKERVPAFIITLGWPAGVQGRALAGDRERDGRR